MKDLLLIPIISATFAFGYYVVAKFGGFIEENQRLIAEGNREGHCHVRAAAENPLLLDSAAPALESCCPEKGPEIKKPRSCDSCSGNGTSDRNKSSHMVK